jgi:hypothetical protein
MTAQQSAQVILMYARVPNLIWTGQIDSYLVILLFATTVLTLLLKLFDCENGLATDANDYDHDCVYDYELPIMSPNLVSDSLSDAPFRSYGHFKFSNNFSDNFSDKWLPTMSSNPASNSQSEALFRGYGHFQTSYFSVPILYWLHTIHVSTELPPTWQPDCPTLGRSAAAGRALAKDPQNLLYCLTDMIWLMLCFLLCAHMSRCQSPVIRCAAWMPYACQE